MHINVLIYAHHIMFICLFICEILSVFLSMKYFLCHLMMALLYLHSASSVHRKLLFRTSYHLYVFHNYSIFFQLCQFCVYIYTHTVHMLCYTMLWRLFGVVNPLLFSLQRESAKLYVQALSQFICASVHCPIAMGWYLFVKEFICPVVVTSTLILVFVKTYSSE